MDPAQIIDSILSILSSERDPEPQAVEQLNRQLTEALTPVNARLRRCDKLLTDGQRSQAIELCETKPQLLGLVALLNFPQRAAWDACTRKCKLTVSPVLQWDVAHRISEALRRPVAEPVRRQPIAGSPPARHLAVSRSPTPPVPLRRESNVSSPSGPLVPPPLPRKSAPRSNSQPPPVPPAGRFSQRQTLLIVLLTSAITVGATMTWWPEREPSRLLSPTVVRKPVTSPLPAVASPAPAAPALPPETLASVSPRPAATNDLSVSKPLNSRRDVAIQASAMSPSPATASIASHSMPPGLPPQAPLFLTLPVKKWDGTDTEQKICELTGEFAPEIIGGTVVLGDGQNFSLRRNREDELTWTLFGVGDAIPAATFRLEDHSLYFEWTREADARTVIALPRCLLRMGPGQKPVPLSVPLQLIAPCVLPDVSTPAHDLSIDGEEVIPRAALTHVKIGEWRFNDLGDFSAMVPMTPISWNDDQAARISISKGGRDIAFVECQIKELRDSEASLAMEMKLTVALPIRQWNAKMAPLWDQKTRQNDNKEYSLKKIASKVESLQGAKAMAELRLNELLTTGEDILKSDSRRNGNQRSSERERLLDDSGSLNAAGKAIRDRVQKEILISDRELAELDVLQTWRTDMDELTTRLATTSRLSFDIWYECKVDGNTQKVMLGTGTTKLPDP